MTGGWGFETIFGTIGEDGLFLFRFQGEEDKTFVVIPKEDSLDVLRKIQSDLAMTQILEGSENIGDVLYRCELMEEVNKGLKKLEEMMK